MRAPACNRVSRLLIYRRVRTGRRGELVVKSSHATNVTSQTVEKRVRPIEMKFTHSASIGTRNEEARENETMTYTISFTVDYLRLFFRIRHWVQKSLTVSIRCVVGCYSSGVW